MKKDRAGEVPHRRGRHRSWRLFHRIIAHGVVLLVLEAVAVIAIAATVGRAPQWLQFAEGLATHLTRETFTHAADPARMQTAAEELKRSIDVDLSLYTPDGTLLASNVNPPLPRVSAERLLSQEGRPVAIGHHPTRIVTPAIIDGKTVGYSVSQMPRSEPDYVRGILIGLAIMLVLGLASIPVARSIASPLERLTRAARALGQGDLSTRADIRCSRVREVGELAEAFDEMAARLEKLVRNEKELLANVSHELRTPMARIRIALELATEGDFEQARRGLGEIGVDLGELEKLVEDVLATARLDLAAGKSSAMPPLNLEPIQPRELLERALARFQSAHPGRELALAISAPLPEIQGDEKMLKRVLDNLLDNARKYSDERIVLAAAPGTEGLSVEVRDRGIGIDPEDQTRLFTPFFRTDRSRFRGTGGVGLGLALSRRIVEAHGGHIQVKSAPGEGTVVHFTLPTV